MILPTGNKAKSSVKRPVDRAFTLIELILVMAMLMIVLSVSAPSLSRFFRGRNLDAEARRFLTLTHYGQERAVSEGLPMLLWVDAQQKRYGLRAEGSYDQDDPRALVFEMGPDLRIEIGPLQVPRTYGSSGTLLQSLRTLPTTVSNLPAIRFTPDGYIGEGSPQWLKVWEREDGLVGIQQCRNRLRYEISTNQLETRSR